MTEYRTVYVLVVDGHEIAKFERRSHARNYADRRFAGKGEIKETKQVRHNGGRWH